MQDQGIDWPLPELDDGMHIVDALISAGPMGTGGMGPTIVSWQEIQAWKQATASPLKPHELSLLRELSGEYLEQWFKAKDRNCPSPELVLPEGEKAKRLVSHIKSVLRG